MERPKTTEAEFYDACVTPPKVELYDACVAAGLTIDHHESALYVKACPEALRLIQESRLPYESFIDNIDHELWYDVYFAYLPFWREKTGNGEGSRKA